MQQISNLEEILFSIEIKLNWKRVLFQNKCTLMISNRVVYLIKDKRLIHKVIGVAFIQALTFNLASSKEFIIHINKDNDLHLRHKNREEILDVIKHVYFSHFGRNIAMY
jgi:hypothetical protein